MFWSLQKYNYAYLNNFQFSENLIQFEKIDRLNLMSLKQYYISLKSYENQNAIFLKNYTKKTNCKEKIVEITISSFYDILFTNFPEIN